MTGNPQNLPVVVCLNGGSYPQPFTQTGSPSSGPSFTSRVVYDSHQVHREFPARWQSYILAHYSSARAITCVFNVSERTARNWMKGDFGAVGGHVAIAVREHGDTALKILFSDAT
jgi:hypothetical protein